MIHTDYDIRLLVIGVIRHAKQQAEHGNTDAHAWLQEEAVACGWMPANWTAATLQDGWRATQKPQDERNAGGP